MDRACGTVVGLDDGKARVTTSSAGACAACHAKGACGDIRFGDAPPTRTVIAFNPLGAAVGDTVVLDVSPRGVIAAAALLYLVPTIAGIAGAAAGATWGGRIPSLGPDATAVLLFLAAVALAFLAVRRIGRRIGERRAFRVSIVEVLPSPEGDRSEETEGSDRAG